MSEGEEIKIERTISGHYRITMPDGTVMIGGAASTIVVLANAIFKLEASGDMIAHS